VNQQGTWQITAHEPNGVNTNLTYSVNWGDEVTAQPLTLTASLNSISQQTTFSHAYAAAGTYTATFTVTDSSGNSNSSTITVAVSGSQNSSASALITVYNGLVYSCSVNSCNVPLAGATVSLYSSSGNLIQTTFTDSSGQVRFSGLVAGSYTVVISKN